MKTVNLIFLLISTFLGFTTGTFKKSDEGYVIATSESNPTGAASTCPSKNIIRVKYKCLNSGGKWIDCIRQHCCPGFHLIGGKCVSKDTDPCTLNLCEQRCDVILRRVVCTCWSGYRFSPERQERGERPTCIDIDECAEGSHDCEHICVNSPGEFSCRCREGFLLRGDNRTCGKIESSGDEKGARECFANCGTVAALQQRVRTLQEKMAALGTAVKVSMYSVPEAKATSPKEDEVRFASAGYSENPEDKTYTVLDSFVQSGGGFCKCQRGPVGPPGAPGSIGQKGDQGEKGHRGPKGSAGSFDFLLLLLADVRHDIVLLQERVFPGETLPKFDVETVLKKQRSTDSPRTDGIQAFEGTKALISDYSMGDGPESSGDELDQY